MAAESALIKRAKEWLAAWQHCIRGRDYAQARTLFDAEVLAFGTLSARMSGLDSLVAEQWMKVWEHTRDFEFDLGHCTVVLAEADFCVLALPWTCVAVNHGAQPERRRSGRASIVLKVTKGALRCVHTHFSIDPVPEMFAQ